MTKLELLQEEAREAGIIIDEKRLQEDDVYDGLCFCGCLPESDIILLNKHRTIQEQTCALAEELGHYHKSVGNIIDQSSVTSRKSEDAGRVYSYKRLARPEKIRSLLRAGWFTFHEIAEELGVTVGFLMEAMEYYQRKGIPMSSIEPDKPDEAAALSHNVKDAPPKRRAALMKLLKDSAVGTLPKFISEVCDERQEEKTE